MLELAAKAGLPLIKVTTQDVINYFDVIEHILGKGSCIRVAGAKDLDTDHKFCVWYAPKMLSFKDLYSHLMEKGKVVVLVNPEGNHPLVFDAGVLPTPKDMVKSELLSSGYTVRQADKLLPALSGMDLIRVGEACRLAMAKFGPLTAQGISTIKQMMSATDGLVGVDTVMDFYIPDERLEAMVEKDEGFFLYHDDYRLQPRGILLYGDPGVGKSQAAKFIARKWKVPLFLLDLSSTFNKYIGESEKNMRSVLAKIDAEAPCILLMDEVEKLFQSDDNSGTSTRLLSQLLWWLQEHRGRVFTVMTSNDIKKIPKEMYRVGRIDSVMELQGIKKAYAEEFALNYLAGFDMADEVDLLELSKAAIKSLYVGKSIESHASIVGAVKAQIKQILLSQGDVSWNEK